MIRNMIFIIVLLVSGCVMKPGETATLNVFTSADRFNNYWMLKHDDYEAMTPLAKDSDWGQLWSNSWNPQGGWHGGQSDSGHGLHLATTKGHLNYDIDFYVSISPYSAKDRALENGDEEFISKKYKQGIEERGGTYYQNGRIYYINAHIEKHGRENYACLIYEEFNPAKEYYKVEKREKTFSCIKSNPEKTMIKKVSIILSYTKAPTLPKELESLSKEYTYEDLQERAKRMLDSLYIKDGWDE